MSRNDLRVVNKIVPRDKIIVVSFPSSISPPPKKGALNFRREWGEGGEDSHHFLAQW